MKIRVLLIVVSAIACLAASLHADETTGKKNKLRSFDTPYYILKTDLPEVMARETDLHMTRMFEEYKRRTAGFAGEPKGKFPFLLFQDVEDYHAAGGMANTAGVFNRNDDTLMAYTGDHVSTRTWHVIQHEGFHQFAFHTIHGDLPPWLNEGLAEYFGDALFTGDSYVSGFIHPSRLEGIKDQLKNKQWQPFAVLTTLTRTEWNNELKMARGDSNYDQAWAMVHFLAHGDDGKYQKAFSQYINFISGGKSSADAWTAVFGKDAVGFQEKCEKWWKSLPEYPTNEIYEKATVLRMTSILARCTAMDQSFTDFADLVAHGRPTDLKLSRDLWLPPVFVDDATVMAPKVGKWNLDKPKGQPPRLTCLVRSGSTYTGTFTLTGKKFSQVAVTMTPPGAEGPTTTTKPGASTTTKPASPTTKPAPKPTTAPAH